MKNDTYTETGKITSVTLGKDWHSVNIGSMGCGMKASYGVIPKVGDTLSVYSKGGAFGTIRGMDLNGQKVFWKTDEDLETERLEWLRNHEEEKQQKFKDGVAKMDEQYNALPKCFQERIDKFRTNNNRFRIDYESYELFCCEQALVIVKGCKTPEDIQKFAKLDWKEQLKLVPELSDGHSGNTFGAAVHLAYWYLQQPENVVKMRGALAPLVGSEEYGCVAKESQ